MKSSQDTNEFQASFPNFELQETISSANPSMTPKGLLNQLTLYISAKSVKDTYSASAPKIALGNLVNPGMHKKLCALQ
jgi:hypothetical protein